MSRPSTKLFAQAAFLLFAATVNSGRACAEGTGGQQLYSETHLAMGTTYEIFLYADTADIAHSEMQAAWDEVDRIDDLLSNYKPASELSRVSHNAAQGPVTTDPETFRFLQTSIDWSRRTDGAFDMTVGRLMRTWGFFQNAGAVPSDAMLADARQELGWKHVVLDAQRSTVSFVGTRGMELDPGGIGKGYAVDKVVALFRAEGVKSALISAGSSTVYALGAPQGKAGWSVAIPDPTVKGKVLEHVVLKDTSLSTSACTEKFFVQNGHHYCHIMDPQTLRPVEGMLHTAAICTSATESDVLSLVLFVLGAQKSDVLLANMPEAAGLIISGDAHHSSTERIRWPAATAP